MTMDFVIALSWTHKIAPTHPTYYRLYVVTIDALSRESMLKHVGARQCQ
jgi:hypothetical protein